MPGIITNPPIIIFMLLVVVVISVITSLTTWKILNLLNLLNIPNLPNLPNLPVGSKIPDFLDYVAKHGIDLADLFDDDTC